MNPHAPPPPPPRDATDTHTQAYSLAPPSMYVCLTKSLTLIFIQVLDR